MGQIFKCCSWFNEMWCVPFATHVPCIRQSYNRVLSIVVCKFDMWGIWSFRSFGCDPMSLGAWFLMFWSIIAPISSMVMSFMTNSKRGMAPLQGHRHTPRLHPYLPDWLHTFPAGLLPIAPYLCFFLIHSVFLLDHLTLEPLTLRHSTMSQKA